MADHEEPLFERVVYVCLDGLRNKLLECFGDFRQIAPVVTNRCRPQAEIVLFYSFFMIFMERYSVRTLSTNMRPIGLSSENIENLTLERKLLFLAN